MKVTTNNHWHELVCGAQGEAIGRAMCNGCGEAVDICEHFGWSDANCATQNGRGE